MTRNGSLPDALRPTEIHDFSDWFRERDGRVNRPLIVVIAIAALLTIGHFAYRSDASATAHTAASQTVIHRG